MNEYRTFNNISNESPTINPRYIDSYTQEPIRPYHHQMSPYGQPGKPFTISKHPIYYPKQTKSQTLTWNLFQKRRLVEQLRKCFPANYVLTHAICLIVLNLVQIGLQIALMATNGALWFVAAGIWAGVYFVVTGVLTIILGLRKIHK
jgi:hypothetical protein